MKVLALSVLFSLSTSVFATVHSGCYQYFMDKDGCIYSSADGRNRCGHKKEPTHPVCRVAFNHKHKKRDLHHLEKRYDTTRDSFVKTPATPSEGICGDYNTTTDFGVCLWSGNSTSTGWVNGTKTSNCHKQVYVQRKGQPNTVKFARVIDGCDFGAKTADDGCFQIGLTEALFFALNPTKKENSTGTLSGLSWDFNNLNGLNSQAAPV